MGWLAENPDKNKRDWPGWKSNGGTFEDIETYCFACDYVSEKGLLRCDKCPLAGWGSDGDSCMGMHYENLFSQWVKCEKKDYNKRTEIAKQICDLSVREGVEYV